MAEITSKSDLRKLTLPALRRLAADRGIPVCRDFTRADLIDALAARMGLRQPKSAWQPGDEILS